MNQNASDTDDKLRAALATIDGTLELLLRYADAQVEESAFAYVRIAQLKGLRDVARAALAASATDEGPTYAEMRAQNSGNVYYCQTCGKTRFVEWLHRECPSDVRAVDPPSARPAVPEALDVELDGAAQEVFNLFNGQNQEERSRALERCLARIRAARAAALRPKEPA